MKVIVKGGVWRNAEDEILKAAVSKYGKNQWARISSLLVRKSPKQCKARWFEWLDPSIKKTEWSKEEDEKLLHLAKLMPTQWRTIAPIVGRTPSQCLERYQKLLDEAEAREAGDELGLAGQQGAESAPSADEVRRLRPGEIDPDPEARPARPDPVDMEEDEKEMLSEARARLANTQGKKAKRKARERQLEEARRLSMLQKRRELKAAGITMRIKKKKGVMDYNADIPFEKKPAAGFYDVTEERSRPVDRKLTNVHLQKLEKRRADEEDDRSRSKRRKDQKATEVADARKSLMSAQEQQRIQAMQEAEQMAMRRKLTLPAPQVGEKELEEIVKVGLSEESAKTLMDDESQITSGLVEKYALQTSSAVARTPRTQSQGDSIMTEARNQRLMTTTETPLLGGENTPFIADNGTGFEGATPRRGPAQTPNPFATPLRGSQSFGGDKSMQTPMRDNLKINTPAMVGETPREEKMRRIRSKQQLRQSLLNLPQPKNEFEIDIPDVAPPEDTSATAQEAKVFDASDAEAVQRKMAEEAKAEMDKRRSHAVHRNLPRPVGTNFDWIVDEYKDLDPQDPEYLIAVECAALLQHDAVKYPVVGSKVTPGATKVERDVEEEFASTMLKAAAEEIEVEIQKELGTAEWRPLLIQHLPPPTDPSAESIFLPKLGKFTEIASLTESELCEGYHKQLQANRSAMQIDAQKAAKLEKRLTITLGGYQNRSKNLAEQIKAAYEELEEARQEYQDFERLQMMEKAAVPLRLESLQREVDNLTRRENELQQRYKDLAEEKDVLVERLGLMTTE
ncbi:hypothetical protein BZG36_04168 [Bifiguratus adelaidae]|uniref:Pre-mRNA-splicing factor cef1 n=1 Tax=Bifiguratus adelaidae TaxID=1938954 RepID=A0A261XYV0_9FUNG|nr:hypothetical protein BZG36_04168 [Bifiguratus adelaidae]